MKNYLNSWGNEWISGWVVVMCVWICGCYWGLNMFIRVYIQRIFQGVFHYLCRDWKHKNSRHILWEEEFIYIMRQIFKDISSNLHKSYLKFYIQTHTHTQDIVVFRSDAISAFSLRCPLINTSHRKQELDLQSTHYAIYPIIHPRYTNIICMYTRSINKRISHCVLCCCCCLRYISIINITSF